MRDIELLRDKTVALILIKIYILNEKYNRVDLAEELNIDESTVTRKIIRVNYYLAECYLYKEIRYVHSERCYKVINV